MKKIILIPGFVVISLIVGCWTNDKGPFEPVTTYETSIPGHQLQSDERWSGTVHLTGDIVIPMGISLTIDPGTTIYVTTQQPDWDSGFTKNKVDIYCKGTLIAIGTPMQRITFISDSSAPNRMSWRGIGFSGDAMTLKYCTVACAEYGVFNFTLSSSPLQCENCLFYYDNEGIVNFHSHNSFHNLTFDRCYYGYAQFMDSTTADLTLCEFLNNQSIDIWSVSANQHISVSQSNFVGTATNLRIFSSVNPQSCTISADNCFGIANVNDSTSGGRGTITQTSTAFQSVPGAGCGFSSPGGPFAASLSGLNKTIRSDELTAAEAREINKNDIKFVH